MQRIFHLATPAAWQAAVEQPYRSESLSTEGFIHCSFGHQVAWAANRFYTAAAELLALEIDPDRLTSPVRSEEADTGDFFPHIYGPLDRSAVVAEHRLGRGADGRWVFPPQTA